MQQLLREAEQERDVYCTKVLEMTQRLHSSEEEAAQAKTSLAAVEVEVRELDLEKRLLSRQLEEAQQRLETSDKQQEALQTKIRDTEERLDDLERARAQDRRQLRRVESHLRKLDPSEARSSLSPRGSAKSRGSSGGSAPPRCRAGQEGITPSSSPPSAEWRERWPAVEQQVKRSLDETLSMFAQGGVLGPPSSPSLTVLNSKTTGDSAGGAFESPRPAASIARLAVTATPQLGDAESVER